jgi:hypothetical protein
MLGRLLLSLVLGFAALVARADTPPLLDAAITHWSSAQGEWHFIRKTRTLNDKGAVKAERVEVYDPSLSDDQRWQLTEVDGHAPTEAQLKAESRKNRRPRKYGTGSPGEFLDLPHAVVRGESPGAVTFEIQVRTPVPGLAQPGKLIVLLTVDRKTEEIERLNAQLLGPMRIALGLAKLTDVDLDLIVDPEEQKAVKAEGTAANGTARVTVAAFGERMEYEWSALKRVPGHGR